MAKILILISQRNFNDTEFNVTKNTLKQRGAQVTIASIDKDDAISMEGMKIKPDKELRSINPNDYDCLVIIGGSGTPKLLDFPEVALITKKFDEQKKIIAAICLAPIVLAKAGILKGVISTVFPAQFAIGVLKKENATYSELHVIEDDNIITADGPEVAKEFVDKILKKFNL